MVKIEAIGRLTKELELLPISNEKNMVVANFTLACRVGKKTEKVKCTAWNEVARTIKEYTNTGSMLYACGRLETKEWVDDKTQIRHERIYMIVEQFEFLSAQPKESKLDI